MPQHSMLELSVAHGLLFNSQYRPNRFTAKTIRPVLEGLNEKSDLVRGLIAQQGSVDKTAERMAFLLSRIENNTLERVEKRWLDVHQRSLESLVTRLVHSKDPVHLEALVAGLRQSKLMQSAELQFLAGLSAKIERALGEERFAPKDLERLLSEEPTPEARDAFEKEIRALLDSTPREPFRLEPAERGVLSTICRKALYLSPADVPVPRPATGWPPLVDAAARLRGAGGSLGVSRVWDLLHYGANFGHLPAGMLVHPEREGHQTTLDLLSDLQQELRRRPDQLDSEVLASLDEHAKSEVSWRRFIRGIKSAG